MCSSIIFKPQFSNMGVYIFPDPVLKQKHDWIYIMFITVVTYSFPCFNLILSLGLTRQLFLYLREVLVQKLSGMRIGRHSFQCFSHAQNRTSSDLLSTRVVSIRLVDLVDFSLMKSKVCSYIGFELIIIRL